MANKKNPFAGKVKQGNKKKAEWQTDWEVKTG